VGQSMFNPSRGQGGWSELLCQRGAPQGGGGGCKGWEAGVIMDQRGAGTEITWPCCDSAKDEYMWHETSALGRDAKRGRGTTQVQNRREKLLTTMGRGWPRERAEL